MYGAPACTVNEAYSDGARYPELFTKEITGVNVPALVGVPVMVPVFWFNDKPGGRLFTTHDEPYHFEKFSVHVFGP